MPVRPISKLSRGELANLNAFLTVEKCRSFTQAALELGVTTSALSHTIKKLESKIGVRLLNRTSRNVAPTEAGAKLACRLEGSFKEISDALDDVELYRSKPKGRLRITVLCDGAKLVLGKYLPKYLQRYPEVELEISVNDNMVDIVSSGFDAGIRHGGSIPADLIANRLGPDQKWITVASPKYLYGRNIPQAPEDLQQHNCIQMRTGSGAIYKWEFEKQGEYRVVDVPGQVCANETSLILDLARAGVGIAYCLEARAQEYLKSGELTTVLEEWATIDPPMYLYYPGHRQIPPGLSELAELLREEMAREMENKQ